MPNTIITTDPTYEGLFKLFEEGRPSMGLFSDEGGQLVGGYGMNKENRTKTISGLSKFWDGTPLNRTRAGSNCINIYRKRLAIHLLLQPRVSDLIFSDILTIEQGILSRFLITFPVSRIGYRNRSIFSSKSKNHIEDICRKINELFLTKLNIEENTKNNLLINKLHLSPEAKEILYEFNQDIEVQQRKENKFYHIKAHASKAAEMSSRIAAVLTLFKDQKSRVIEKDNMQNAITLVEFYLNEAKRIICRYNIPKETLHAKKILEWMQGNNKNFFTFNELMQKSPRPRSKDDLLKALNILEKHNWITYDNDRKNINCFW